MRAPITDRAMLERIHRSLGRHFGPLHWWPGETPFEVCVGAILTQNTAWTNVEKAMANLEARGVLDPPAMLRMPEADLAALIRPSGYYNVKARRLRELLSRLDVDFGLDLDRLFALPATEMRAWLLSVNGIGKETADSIVLYAAGKPIFVVDAYTKRVFGRHGFIPASASYDEVQEYFERRLPRRASLYNEYHAQIVNLAKDYCRKTPRCETCPLAWHLAAIGGRPRDEGSGSTGRADERHRVGRRSGLRAAAGIGVSRSQ